eukprot:TRINITY_DN11448_c0_g1_i1.p1 TRINITY_DN11448_c0_g1~~TRINITY_DN11448_c0_g1_i1.p1  ORF type:complete len:717 (+),score=141.96 TRINITY_DN11448_c0_g1_i1:110-2260(+)
MAYLAKLLNKVGDQTVSSQKEDILDAFAEVKQELEEKLTKAEEKLTKAEEKLSEKDQMLRKAYQQLSEKERKLSEKDQKLSEKDQRLSEKDQKLSEKDQKLDETYQKLSETERKLHEDIIKLKDELLEALRNAVLSREYLAKMAASTTFQKLSRRAFSEMSANLNDCPWQAMLQEDGVPSGAADGDNYGIPALQNVVYHTNDGVVTAKLITDESEAVCHRPNWTSETNRQKGLMTMSELLNKVHARSLHWDLGISTKPTLRYLKPDGHGRIDKKQSPRHVAGQAVLIEVKATDKMNVSETCEQILEYCVLLLELDPQRKHVVVFLTDLKTWRLFKVTRRIFDQPLDEAAKKQAILCSLEYPWKKEGQERVLGLEMLAYLGTLSRAALGLSPQVEQLQHHLIDTFLGGGLTATVYKLDDGRVLKLAHDNENARKDLASEVDILLELKGKVEGLPYSSFVPALDTSEPTGTESCTSFIFKPYGQRLAAATLAPVMIREFLDFLRWLHEKAKVYHGDVSYRNMLQAPKDWAEENCTSPTPQIVLIDWGLSKKIPPSGVTQGAQGTPATLSQSMLESIISGKSGSFNYAVADELESAVKSLILILAPSVKREITFIIFDKPTSSRRATVYKRLKQAWDSLLKPTGLWAICQKRDYTGIAAWFSSPDNRFFVEHASVTSSLQQQLPVQQEEEVVPVRRSKRLSQSRPGKPTSKKANRSKRK